MKNSVFVDTAYLVALTNASDRHHGEAVSLAEAWTKQRQTFLTTDAVLIEYGNFFARSPLRRLAAATVARLRATQGWTVVPMVRDVLARAEARYASHLDKAWSVTDCLSMEVMHDQKLSDVATTDAHFAQAGFRPLMRGGGGGD
jgi:predicted nucleic acid-binding protein